MVIELSWIKLTWMDFELNWIGLSPTRLNYIIQTVWNRVGLSRLKLNQTQEISICLPPSRWIFFQVSAQRANYYKWTDLMLLTSRDGNNLSFRSSSLQLQTLLWKFHIFRSENLKFPSVSKLNLPSCPPLKGSWVLDMNWVIQTPS